MHQVKFAVVTVVKNNLIGLKETRKSLDAQTFKNWQHIIIDGESLDGTKDYLETLPSLNTQWISEKDLGIYNAMNKALRLINSDVYVYFLNADDSFATVRSLEFAARNLADNNLPLWGCSTHEEIALDGTGWICKLVSKPSIENQLYAIGYRSHQAVVVRSSLILDVNGFNEDLKIAADWDLIVKCMLICEPIVWKESLGRFKLGGFSSINIVQAHMELRILRRMYLERKFFTPIYDFLWTTIYTPFERRHQCSNIFDVLSFLIQRLFIKKQTTAHFDSKFGKFFAYFRYLISYLNHNLFNTLNYRDFRSKENFLNRYQLYNRIRLGLFQHSGKFSNALTRISRPNWFLFGKVSVGKNLNYGKFINFLHGRLKINPFE